MNIRCWGKIHTVLTCLTDIAYGPPCIHPILSHLVEHPPNPVPVTVATSGHASFSQEHTGFSGLQDCSDICLSLDSPENRTRGKGLCVRILFRSVPGSISMEAGNGGERSSMRVCSQSSHRPDTKHIGSLDFHLPRGHIKNCYSGTSARGRINLLAPVSLW